MHLEVNPESLKTLSASDYKKALKKDKKYLKKSDGILFLNDHKFADGKKGLAILFFKKEKEAKESFKEIKKGGHPAAKMAGGSCELVNGANGEELKIELKLGSLSPARIEKKGKITFATILGIKPQIVSGEGFIPVEDNSPDDEIDELDDSAEATAARGPVSPTPKIEPQDKTADLTAHLTNELKSISDKLALVKDVLEKAKEKKVTNEDALFMNQLVKRISDWLSVLAEAAKPLQDKLKDKADQLKSSHEKLVPLATKVQELVNQAASGRGIEKTAAPVATSIKASVGKGGKNEQSDVKLVQTLLNKKGNSLTVDGDCGAKTILAIEKFQKEVVKLSKPDGLIDPGGKTWTALSQAGTGQPTQTTPPKETTAVQANAQLTAAVGSGKSNKPGDVAAIQTLLNKQGNQFKIDGIFSPSLAAAIEKFQKEVVKLSKPDGVVDPGGKTWKALKREQVPAASTGTPTGPLSKPNWISIAEAEIGTKEIVGSKHNPRIIEYHATTGKSKDDETAWCSSFVNWVMEKAGQGGTKSAMAVSWAKWGKKVSKPAYGAIAVIDWDGPGPGWKGHVGFVVGMKGNSILLLGGNQNNAVNIKSFGTSKVIAYVYPKNFEIPANYYNFGELDGDFGDDTDISSTR